MNKAKGITGFLVENYYLIVIALYLLAMIYKNMHVGVYASFLMCLIFAGLMIRGKISIMIKGTDIYVLLFVLYSLATAIAYLVSDVPITVFFSAASNALLPVIFYVAGKKGMEFKKKAYYYAINICCMVGVFLLVTKPEWYVSYCKERGISYTRL